MSARHDSPRHARGRGRARSRGLALVRRQDGFTMIIALGVMLVTSLLMIVAFTAANGDITLSHEDLTQKQAYFAALAGVQEYEYKLQNNPNFWQTCEEPKSTVPEEASERYEVKLLVASSAKGFASCSTSSPFASVIESGGSLANTFRVESIGYSGTDKRRVIATFQVSGFLNYVYFTNFEQGDPKIFGSDARCEGLYYSQWSPKGYNCQEIEFTNGDSVNGPMHTNDSADVGGSTTFGRKEHSPLDPIEMNGGTHGGAAGCKSSAKYYSATAAAGECYTTKAQKIEPPESDTSLGVYVQEGGLEFEGATHLELKGSTINASYFNAKGEEVVEKGLAWPTNGLIYVQASGTCPAFNVKSTDTAATELAARGCGNVYVTGTYSKSLTIAGENDLIINGSVYPTALEGKLGEAPTGTPTLGLIATNYVRVYHPCSGGNNGGTSLSNPYIYAAILSTTHSFVVDNFDCGAELGKLHEYGAIAQNYRGAVGTGAGTGYIKDYKYDERLATDEPPYFLAPLKAGWKIIRETAPTAG
jgi:Tfp pilus assembly protein PilE